MIEVKILHMANISGVAVEQIRFASGIYKFHYCIVLYCTVLHCLTCIFEDLHFVMQSLALLNMKGDK